MPKAGDQDIDALKNKALEHAPQALTLIDLQGKRLWANKAFCELLGKPHEALLGVSVELTYPLEEQERVKQALTQETLQKGGISNFETWFEKNGKRVYVQIHTSLIRDERGDPSAIIYSAADISAQKNRLDVLLDGLAEGVCVADSSGSIHYLNPSYATFMGKPKEALLQEGWHGLFPQEEWPNVAQLLAGLEDEEGSDEAVVSESVHLLPGGQRRVAKRTLRPIVWEGKRRVLVSLSDVTELKQAQLDLDFIFENTRAAVCLTDKQGRWIRVNRAFERDMGYSREELLGKTTSELPGTTEETLKALRTLWAYSIEQKGENPEPFDVPWKRKDGSLLIHSAHEVPFGMEGEGRLYTAVDVTELRLTQEKLNRQLEFSELMVELSKDAILILKEDGTILESNRSAKHLFGHENLAGMSCYAFSPPDEMELHRQGVENIVHRGHGTCPGHEYTMLKTDGAPFTASVFHGESKDPETGEERVLLFVRDITQLRLTQEKLEELVEAQQQTIKELSTPIIPVWSRVIMAPLLGSFDSQRMHDLSEKLLEEIASKKPKAALLDLSGLIQQATQVISEIVRLITSVRILGARTILSGITPHVAQSLVRLGANLDGIPTYATLEQALRSVVGEAVHAKGLPTGSLF